tara:strand:+ start:9917 stop:10036 length:120 start_codon:yes stop_codon:yes gene_type:complete
MAKPNSRQTLIEYCLRSLGAPVVEINSIANGAFTWTFSS